MAKQYHEKVHHIFSPRMYSIFSRHETHCGKGRREDPKRRRSQVVDDWEKWVHVKPDPDTTYCQLCGKHFRRDGVGDLEKYPVEELPDIE